MIDVRSVVRRAVLLAVVAVIAAACGGTGDTDGDGAPVVVAPPKPDYSNIGRGDSPLCGNGSGQTACQGSPPVDFRDSALVGRLNAFLNESRWAEETGPIEMMPENGTAKQTFWVSAVKESRRFEFRQKLDERAHVVARIRANPNGPKDRMYKIGGFTEPMREYFYLVVRQYDASDTSEPADAQRVGPSRRISRWEIYGITTKDQARLKLVSSGQVRWCGHQHDATVTSKEATVTYCDTTAKSTAAGAGQLAAYPQLFRDPPLWFTCGLGCCIADEFF